MATAPVSFSPALTPHTLGVLADEFERVHLTDKAESLRRLQPFVEDTVKKYFVPLLARDTAAPFKTRFNDLSRDFESVRIYLNIRLFNSLGAQDFLGLYGQVLRDALGSMMETAREMDMCPDLISAAVRDFVRIMQALSQITAAAGPQIGDLTLTQFTDLVEWFHAATRLDYGLTAVFLILEKSIANPMPTDKSALLVTFQRALLDYAHATSMVFEVEPIQHAVQNLETPHIKITAHKQTANGLVLSPEAAAPKNPVGSFARQAEIKWLMRNEDLSERFGGQWIVVEKDELVANDIDYQKARHVATQRGITRPFIIFVPLKESGGFMGI